MSSPSKCPLGQLISADMTDEAPKTPSALTLESTTFQTNPGDREEAQASASSAAVNTSSDDVSAESTTQERGDINNNVTSAAYDHTTTNQTGLVIGVAAEEEEPMGGNSDPPTKKETEPSAGSSWGYVILVLLLLLVVALCIVLVRMRRVSRTYTFDLQRPPPRTCEPMGSFEPVYLDDLDYQVHTTEIPELLGGQENKTEDKEPDIEVSQTNGLQTTAPTESCPTPETGPAQDQQNLDELNQEQQDQQDQDQQNPASRSSPVLFIEEEELNANNNNPSLRSSAFEEINLEESSVLPFSSSPQHRRLY
uniref:Uncharacterized protein n=2 Tax=Knipowitschia caucasica TaxID=637954 RepID=A0AAV2KJI8_KNICA